MIIPFPEQAPLCQQYEEIWISSHQANVEQKIQAHSKTTPVWETGCLHTKNIYTNRQIFSVFHLHSLLSCFIIVTSDLHEKQVITSVCVLERDSTSDNSIALIFILLSKQPYHSHSSNAH